MPDLTLADLAADRWTQVARRIRATPHQDGWEWHLPPADVSVLQVAKLHGSIVTALSRDDTGWPVMLARRIRPSAGPERFAVMGRGMFEQ